MTLMSVEDYRLGWPTYKNEGAYELTWECAVPGCGEMGTEGHHIVPRSRTNGPRDFVTIDGLVVANKCRLCKRHHDHVTGEVGGHKGLIRWTLFPSIEERFWGWYIRAKDAVGQPRELTFISKTDEVWVCLGKMLDVRWK